jgi:hypothetical protein
MKMSMCQRVVAAFALMGALASPAFAQKPQPAPLPDPTGKNVPILEEAGDHSIDVSGAYMFIYDLTGKDDLPKGFLSAVAVHAGPNFGFVGQVKGTYKNGGSIYDYLGGMRIMANGDRATLFVEVTSGLSHASGATGTGNAWVIQPSAGLDWFGEGAAGIRLQAGMVLNRNAGVFDKQLLLSAGLVFRK